jgi:hypothetical protein
LQPMFATILENLLCLKLGSLNMAKKSKIWTDISKKISA